MRLSCPNCDAQYEVPDDVMPMSGRDVQCSNCGQTWFQHHPNNAPETEEPALDAPSPDEEVAPPPLPPAPAPVPERKQLDPAVADILRQEAEAEQAARRKPQAGSLESQPDLSMDFEDAHSETEADRRAQQARDRMARMRSNEPAAPAPATAPNDPSTAAAAASALGSRRDLLPDIDEINSTLRSDASRGGAGDIGPEIEAPSVQRSRRGFRRGFMTVLMIFAVLAIIYVLAPRLSAAVPALEGPLQSYVAIIDQGRGWLDGQVQSLLQSLDSVAEDSNG